MIRSQRTVESRMCCVVVGRKGSPQRHPCSNSQRGEGGTLSVINQSFLEKPLCDEHSADKTG